MNDNDQKRREISALVDDIGRIQRELGSDVTAELRQPDDREAFDIVARIERKVRANKLEKVAGGNDVPPRP